MNPITHGLIGWSTANLAPGLSRRDLAFVVAAALAADLDGLGIMAELATRGSERPLLWWSEYHHTFGHNLTFAVALAAAAWLVTRKGVVASSSSSTCTCISWATWSAPAARTGAGGRSRTSGPFRRARSSRSPGSGL